MDKKVIYNLNNREPHIGEYFEIKYFNNKYYLFYNCEGKIKLVISESVNFVNKQSKTILDNAPNGCFAIIIDENVMYMLVGCHISNKEKNEINIPDLVWPKEKKTILNPNDSRKDRKNGMYLLKSLDGIEWIELTNKPILNGMVESETCKLGEVCFDTHPCLIKYNNEYLYFGRLNSSLDERRIYVRRSKDLKIWSLPEKINIENEIINNMKKNYYNFVVFSMNNKLYAFAPYFEACGTTARKCKNGKTILLSSLDGINWNIINTYFPHDGKYKDRVNSMLVDNNDILVFFREKCTEVNQKIISYKLLL